MGGVHSIDNVFENEEIPRMSLLMSRQEYLHHLQPRNDYSYQDYLEKCVMKKPPLGSQNPPINQEIIMPKAVSQDLFLKKNISIRSKRSKLNESKTIEDPPGLESPPSRKNRQIVHTQVFRAAEKSLDIERKDPSCPSSVVCESQDEESVSIVEPSDQSEVTPRRERKKVKGDKDNKENFDEVRSDSFCSSEEVLRLIESDSGFADDSFQQSKSVFAP